MKTIVAASDFSDHAGWAAQRGALLAKQHGARLELLHVVPEAPLNALRERVQARPQAVAKLVEDVRHALGEAAAALAEGTGAAVEPRVEVGDVLDVIARQCSAADLLVLGAQGTSPLRDAILGTTAERLLGRCARPMLVVKRPAERPYESAVVALDLTPGSEEVLRATQRLAPQAAVTAVHAYEVPFEGRLRLAGVEDGTIDAYRYRAADDSAAAIRALGVASHVGPGYAPHLILEQAKTRRADLIALGKHRRPAVQEMFLGTAARHVLADARSDVLVLPA